MLLLLAPGGGGIALGLMWIFVITFVAVGSTALASMAEDGDQANWALYFIRQKYLFLDLLPPFAIALATRPLRALNPAVREIVWSTDPHYSAFRWAPGVALLLAFGAWALFGAQTGLGGGFQPAEAGKFASILLAATVLLRVDPNADPAKGVARRLESAIWPTFLLGLFGAALSVSLWKKDWGPALIMGLLRAGLILGFVLPLAHRAISVAWRRQQQRDRAPVAFRPKSPRSRFAAAFLGLSIFAGLGLGVLLLPMALSTAVPSALGLSHWTSDPTERLHKLEQEGLTGGRRVVVERFIAWTDLGYDKPA